MKSFAEIRTNRRLSITAIAPDGGSAFWQPTKSTRAALIIWSTGGGWDHVSVSFRNRCPTWDEMCTVKDMFFDEIEMAVQYHPPRKDYVNNQPYCLHLWRPQNADLPKPPSVFV